MFHNSFNALPCVTNVLPRVTEALRYVLPYYKRQFLQYSTHDLFLCNIRYITVHVTMHFERNKYKFLPFSKGYHTHVTINFIKIGNSILVF